MSGCFISGLATYFLQNEDLFILDFADHRIERLFGQLQSSRGASDFFKAFTLACRRDQFGVVDAFATNGGVTHDETGKAAVLKMTVQPAEDCLHLRSESLRRRAVWPFRAVLAMAANFLALEFWLIHA